MYDVITIGSSLIDIFISSNDLESARDGDQQILTYGDKLELSDFRICSGGGASNTAVSFSRLGLKVAVISETGRDEFADLVVKDFTDEGVATNLLVQEKLEKTGGSVLLVGKAGSRVAMVHRGAASMLDPYDIPSFWLTKARWVHLSSIGGRKETLEKIFKTLRGDQDTKLSWNPGKSELKLLVEEELEIEKIPCEVFFVNETEWAMIKEVQEEVLSNFPQVIVTRGKAGGDVYLYGKKSFYYEGQAVKPLDNTGAGDAFASAYVAAILAGKEVDQAIVWGVRNASNVVCYFGAKAGLLHHSQMLELTANNAKLDESYEKTA